MVKILGFLLGMSVLLAGAYLALYNREDGAASSRPKQALDNVRGKARQIEEDQAKQLDEVMKRSQQP